VGLLSYLTGWEQDKAAGNAVLANHLLPYIGKEKRKDIVQYLITAYRAPRYQPEEILRILNDETRAAQLNCVAMACVAIGIEPILKDGIGWRVVKQPHIAGNAVKPINIELCIKWAKIKTGVEVEWPGDDAKIDFTEWYTCLSNDGNKRKDAEPLRGQDITASVTVPLDAAKLGWYVRVELPTGKVCDAKVPLGAKDGVQLRLRGLGLPGLNGGVPGDALVTIAIAPADKQVDKEARAHPGLRSSGSPDPAGLADKPQATATLKIAAEQEDAKAQWLLACHYAQGQGGLSKDQREEVRLLKLAADQGLAEAQVLLGFAYLNGHNGLAANEFEAVRLFKLAAHQGLAEAQCALGTTYTDGRGGLRKDDNAAMRLFALAADQGNADAQYNVALFCEQGRGGKPRDDRKAARFYKLAADQGQAAAQFALAIHYAQGLGGVQQDARAAVQLLQASAAQGNTLGQSALGVYYAGGLGELVQDDQQAAELFKLAADKGEAIAQYSLACFYDKGRGGLPKDDRQAARLLRLAADQGDADAQCALGLYYATGEGGLAKDSDEASYLLTLAADQGHAIAQQALALADR
jgi:TPR repeat protein